MCVVSNIGDHYKRLIPSEYPWWNPNIMPVHDAPSREEFERLKKTVEKMKKELEAAKQQDIEEGNPDCEMDDKVKILKDIAKFVGISLVGIFDDLDKKSGPKT
jgi:hypothetical protein